MQARFNGSFPPRTPNYNYSDAQCAVLDTHCGHHWQVKSQPPLSADDEADIGKWYTNVLMSLLSVDDIVTAIHGILSAAPAPAGSAGLTEWDNTVWLYTSDHGVNMGQFRIPCVKRQVYESNTRIPSFVKAPGVAANAAGRFELVSHVDAVPTLLGLANADEYLSGLPADTFDGRDFSVRLRGGAGDEPLAPWKTETILEYSSLETDGNVDRCDEEHGQGGHIKSTRNNTWIALRVVPADDDDQPELWAPTAGNWLYVEFTDVLFDWNFTCSPFGRASGSPESSLSTETTDSAGTCPAGVTYLKGEKIVADKLGKEVKGVSIAQCCSICAANPHCLFFSSAQRQGSNPGKCWLHSGNTSGYEKVNKVTTGHVRDKPGPVPPPGPPPPPAPPPPPSTRCSAWHAELYDMATDPWQLHNLYYHSNLSNATRLAWHTRLHTVRRCRGSSCP